MEVAGGGARRIHKVKGSFDQFRFIFDPAVELVLACDASSYGVGAVLSHRFLERSSIHICLDIISHY